MENDAYKDLTQAYQEAKDLGIRMAQYRGERYSELDNPFSIKEHFTLHQYWLEGFRRIRIEEAMLKACSNRIEKVDWIKEGF